MEELVIYAKLLVTSNDIGGYINYVFKNIDFDSWENKYILCTRYPNWDSIFPKVGDIGYLSCTFIIAGNKYFNIKTQKNEIYQYDHIRFNKFIDEKVKEKDCYRL